MGPSEKNPGCSSRPGYPVRRRESIADHLAGARARVQLPGDWSAHLATPAFVADLIKRGIINGPVRVPKSTGVGSAQRFRPRDYRDLLEVISLKSQGIKHRSAWIAHLWLRGHDYPIERFRTALLDEVKTLRKLALADFAPRGRLTTIPFSKRFDDRVRKRPEGSLAPETTDLFEPLAALMIRPQAGKDVRIDIARASEVVQSMISEPIAGLEEALTDCTRLSGREQRPSSREFLSTSIRMSRCRKSLLRSRLGFGECLTTAETAPRRRPSSKRSRKRRLNSSFVPGRGTSLSGAARLRACCARSSPSQCRLMSNC